MESNPHKRKLEDTAETHVKRREVERLPPMSLSELFRMMPGEVPLEDGETPAIWFEKNLLNHMNECFCYIRDKALIMQTTSQNASSNQTFTKKAFVTSLADRPIFFACRVGKSKDSKRSNVAKLWLESSRRREYDMVIFDPDLGAPNLFNFFTGMQVSFMEHLDLDAISPLIEHIKKVVTAGNYSDFDALLAFLWQKLAFPGQEHRQLVLVDEFLCGMYSLLVELIRGLFGHYSIVIHTLGSVSKKLGWDFANKLVIVVEDCPTTATLSNVQKMARLVEPGPRDYKGKNLAGFSLDNHASCVCIVQYYNADLFSHCPNESLCITGDAHRMEDKDRFFVLRSLVRDPYVLGHFFTFLQRRHASDKTFK